MTAGRRRRQQGASNGWVRGGGVDGDAECVVLEGAFWDS